MVGRFVIHTVASGQTAPYTEEHQGSALRIRGQLLRTAPAMLHHKLPGGLFADCLHMAANPAPVALAPDDSHRGLPRPMQPGTIPIIARTPLGSAVALSARGT